MGWQKCSGIRRSYLVKVGEAWFLQRLARQIYRKMSRLDKVFHKSKAALCNICLRKSGVPGVAKNQ